jgi:hypothetical protein
MVVLLGFQFSLPYIPMITGFGSITTLTNLLCMAIGAVSIIWFWLCKILLRFLIGIDSAKK